jgi:alpha-ketoglutarate-dependent taurine dioxygenase
MPEFKTMAVTVTPLTPAVGAEVSGVNLASLSDAEFALIEQAWHRHSALLIRGQGLLRPSRMRHRRDIQVRFEPTRLSADYLHRAYELVVPLTRRVVRSKVLAQEHQAQLAAPAHRSKGGRAA